MIKQSKIIIKPSNFILITSSTLIEDMLGKRKKNIRKRLMIILKLSKLNQILKMHTIVED